MLNRSSMRISLLLPVILAAGCIGQAMDTPLDGTDNASDAGMEDVAQGQGMQTISFQTEDGWTIFADYYPAEGPPIILLHMLGSSKERWGSFPQGLNDNRSEER